MRTPITSAATKLCRRAINSSVLKYTNTTIHHQNHVTKLKHVPSLQFSSTTNNNNDIDSSEPTSGSTNFAFDRHLKRLQKDASARAHRISRTSSSPDEPIDYDYFRTEVANRLVDRLDDIIREDGFPLALDIGSGPGFVYRAICSDDGMEGVGGIGGVRKLVQLESSKDMLHRDDDTTGTDDGGGGEKTEEERRCGTYRLQGNEEGPLPFPDGTFDLVISSAALHWVNDLPGLLLEIKRVLKPDGCLIFAMVGGSSTLMELRSSLVLAEMERDGGVSSHVGPFVDFSDVGSLLTNAGFALTTVDVDTIPLSYPNAMVLMEHLQRMGEGNACVNRRESVSRGTFLAAACVYDEMFKLEAGGRDDHVEDREVEATVQVIYAIGWSPHDSQQKPDDRGSATMKVGETVVEKTTAADIDMIPLIK